MSPVATSMRRHGALPFLGATLAGVAAVGVLAAVDPNQPGHYPTCPFLAITGHWCPGCGALRAVHALATGHPGIALERNPFLVIVLPLLAVAWVGWGLRSFGRPAGQRLHPSRIPVALVWGLLAAILVYWIARNLPGWTWLSPA